MLYKKVTFSLPDNIVRELNKFPPGLKSKYVTLLLQTAFQKKHHLQWIREILSKQLNKLEDLGSEKA